LNTLTPFDTAIPGLVANMTGRMNGFCHGWRSLLECHTPKITQAVPQVLTL